MIAEVIIKRGRNYKGRIFVVWGRLDRSSLWEIMGVYSSDLSAREAARDILDDLQAIADRARWSLIGMPTRQGLIESAHATRPEQDATGKCAPGLEQEQAESAELYAAVAASLGMEQAA